MIAKEMDLTDRSIARNWLDNRMCAAGHPESSFPDILPERGLVIEEDGRNIAAVFTYLDSKTAVAGWLITRPELPAATSYKAVCKLLDELPEYARSLGAEYLLTIYGNKGINKMLSRRGYLPGDSKVEEKYIKL